MSAMLRSADSLCRRSAIALVVVLILDASMTFAEEKGVLEQVAKAWQTRQDNVHAARFSWKEDWTWPKGSISSNLELAWGSSQRPPHLVGTIMPPVDTVVSFSSQLLLDKEKVRFEYEGEQWATKAQLFRKVKYLSVFDGEKTKTLHPIGQGSGNWPIGMVRRGGDYRDAALAVIRPLLLVYRPFSQRMRPLNLNSMTAKSDGEVVVEGRTCIGIVERSGRSSMHLWVDPMRDFILVRQLFIDKELPRQQTDIRYRLDPVIGWVPTGWKIVDHNPRGGAHWSLDAVLTNVDLKVVAEPKSFLLEFPPLARVEDERNAEHYILKNDGAKRPILAEDIGATYEQMLNSAPGLALQSPGHFLRLSTVLCLVCVLALGALLWRRLRSKKPIN